MSFIFLVLLALGIITTLHLLIEIRLRHTPYPAGASYRQQRNRRDSIRESEDSSPPRSGTKEIDYVQMRDELRSWIETEKIMAADTTKLIPGAGSPVMSPEQQHQQQEKVLGADDSNAPVAWESPDFSFATLK
jgi:hypothetical protein